jgi:hypothetical protein
VINGSLWIGISACGTKTTLEAALKVMASGLLAYGKASPEKYAPGMEVFRYSESFQNDKKCMHALRLGPLLKVRNEEKKKKAENDLVRPTETEG